MRTCTNSMGEITPKQEIHWSPHSICCSITYSWIATGTWQVFARQTEEAGGIDSSQKHHTTKNIHRIILLETQSGKTTSLLGMECLQTVPPPSTLATGWLAIARVQDNIKARRAKGAGSLQGMKQRCYPEWISQWVLHYAYRDTANPEGKSGNWSELFEYTPNQGKLN